MHELSYVQAEQAAIVAERLGKFNDEQRAAWDTITTALTDNRPAVFVNGGGGCGKTYLYGALLAFVRARQGMQNRIALAVVGSGIAATLLPGGRTAHSVFKIPVDGLDEHSTCAVARRSSQAALLCA